MDHQRINDQDEGRVIERAYYAAYESLCKIHGYDDLKCGHFAGTVVVGFGEI